MMGVIQGLKIIYSQSGDRRSTRKLDILNTTLQYVYMYISIYILDHITYCWCNHKELYFERYPD